MERGDVTTRAFQVGAWGGVLLGPSWVLERLHGGGVGPATFYGARWNVESELSAGSLSFCAALNLLIGACRLEIRKSESEKHTGLRLVWQNA